MPKKELQNGILFQGDDLSPGVSSRNGWSPSPLGDGHEAKSFHGQIIGILRELEAGAKTADVCPPPRNRL
jgi:hypothetical protein